ncbi:hypothetical protein VNO77_42424 [Canavalia gladiata]|uniref:Bet v I/Major latex protein domain-containing protein n=1 Tax=Canavalia gladiata TaxID=3824 RepID=A0AAN9JUP9_CANGL
MVATVVVGSEDSTFNLKGDHRQSMYIITNLDVFSLFNICQSPFIFSLPKSLTSFSLVLERMVLAGKVSTELGIHTSAAKFFNLFVQQLHHVQNITDRVHETKLHQGDWHGIGSVKSWTYTIDGKVTTCKEKIESINPETKSATFVLFDGDVGKLYKILKAHLEVIDKDDSNAIVKWTYEYEKLNEDVPSPNGYMDFITKLTRDVDAHLLKA